MANTKRDGIKEARNVAAHLADTLRAEADVSHTRRDYKSEQDQRSQMVGVLRVIEEIDKVLKG